MIITYHGGEFFKVQFGEAIVAFNPISKESKLKSTRFGANIALVSLNHPDMNGVDQLSFGDREPILISGPGEYEVRDIFIKGWRSSSGYGGEKKINTVFGVTMEGMSLCFLGALESEKSLPMEMLQAREEDIDILFVPIGGDGVLNPADAYKLAVKLEPKIVIPMHYNLTADSDKNALKTFFKEAGEESASAVDKLTIKKKDLEGKEADLVVISAT
ncbi:MAG: MBL fold metallo-hydrolase [Candidatus Taylorbacteria bacterium]|nr:MBL fold metallo-hydrolase [Candidatus Taylorbacteria bacterium]